MQTRKKLAHAIDEAGRMVALEGAHPYLEDIIASLRLMTESLGESRDRRSQMAAALGRLLTEDLAFCESALGTELLRLAADFATLPDE